MKKSIIIIAAISLASIFCTAALIDTTAPAVPDVTIERVTATYDLYSEVILGCEYIVVSSGHQAGIAIVHHANCKNH